MRTILFAILVLAINMPSNAQLLQSVRGTVSDKESQVRLAGVLVSFDTADSLATVTDSNGNFLLLKVPVGKRIFHFSTIGYQDFTLTNLEITSGKETILPVQLEESTKQRIGEITVRSRREHLNELAIVSARTFDVQEVSRYAGSRADPARMASNFAGVQGSDDSRNDIIVRGNSPQGVIYRLEDIDIPNPSHFADAGSSGGPVSMINTKSLGNSEFFTGAFPAEYGNATAGVFDLKMRNGNNQRHEFTAQLGFLGTEVAAEGPLSRRTGASYLFTYRYSSLKLFEGLNIKIGTNSVPNYQDASFKINIPFGKKTTLAFFGLGGLSKIDLIVSNLTGQADELYGESDRDQYYHSNTGILGTALSHTFNATTFTKFTIAASSQDIGAHHDKVFRDANFVVDSLKNILGFSFKTTTTVAHWFINKKFSSSHILKAGILNNLYHLNLIDSSRQYPPTQQQWQHRENFQGYTDLLQAYVQYKYRPTDKLTLTAGLHGQYLTHNGSKALEPRAGLRWKPGNNSVFTFGYGLHSQLQPMYQYFIHYPQVADDQMHNYNVGFTRSHHFVAGYDRSLNPSFRLHAETYFQYLFNVPVETRASSSFSGINQGATFDRLFPDTLVNKGTGYNYGLELSIEKTFSRNYYFLFTGALFNSKAKGNDGIYRNTDYNGRFATNLLGGYELPLGKNSTLITGVKITYSGGMLYSPPDVSGSNARGDLVLIDTARNTLRFPNYFRTDLKLGVRINAKKVTHEIALDLVNIFGTKNVLSLTYSADLGAQGAAYPFYTQYQLGFLPLFYYRLDFGFGKKSVEAIKP